MPKKYTHDFDIMFSVESDSPDPDSISQAELRDSALHRIQNIKSDEWREACGHVGVFDSE